MMQKANSLRATTASSTVLEYMYLLYFNWCGGSTDAAGVVEVKVSGSSTGGADHTLMTRDDLSDGL